MTVAARPRAARARLAAKQVEAASLERDGPASGAGTPLVQNRAVIVAVVAVRMMQVAADQVVGVPGVRHRLVPAVRPVAVEGVVSAAGVAGGAHARVDCGRGEFVVIHMVAVRVVEVPVVEVIRVAVVLDGGVPAAHAVGVRVPLVGLASAAHRSPPCLREDRTPALPRLPNAVRARNGNRTLIR